MWQVQPVPAEHYTQALSLLGGGGWKSRSAGVEALRNYLRSLPHPENDFWWALDGGRALAAALLIRSPGRTGIILNSPAAAHRLAPAALGDVLGRMAQRCLGEQLILMQSLLPPRAAEDIRVYEAAGFWQLAELIYMRLDLWPMRNTQVTVPAGVEFHSYAYDTREDFIAAISASYEDSLDCPALEGLRDVHDVLAGHEVSGLFRPDLWTLACVDGRPGGVLLLNEIPSEGHLEVVYMGVAKGCRGRGLGRILLARAAQLGLHNGFPALTLAVDSHNRHALRLYQQFGFVETMRRLAYVRTVRDPAPAGNA